jgi:hypothetical protein
MSWKCLKNAHSRKANPDSLVNTMKERFPSADFLLAIERGAKANVKP